MGLKERRAIQDFQTNDYPKLQESIVKAAGFEIPIEVQWDKLAKEDQSQFYKEGFTKIFFEPLRATLESICRDDMGRDALRGSLKKIVITNYNDYGSASACAFEGGTLTLDQHPTANIDDVASRTQHLVEMLEKAL